MNITVKIPSFLGEITGKKLEERKQLLRKQADFLKKESDDNK